jgi:hypothetical protein
VCAPSLMAARSGMGDRAPLLAVVMSALSVSKQQQQSTRPSADPSAVHPLSSRLTPAASLLLAANPPISLQPSPLSSRCRSCGLSCRASCRRCCRQQ